MGSRESTGRQGLLVPHRLEGAGRGLPRGRHVDVRCRSGPPGGTEHRRPRRAAQHAGPDARSVTAAREVPAVRLAAARHRGAGQPARRRQGSCRDDRLGRHARGRWGQGARRGAQGLSAALRDPGQAAGISPVPRQRRPTVDAAVPSPSSPPSGDGWASRSRRRRKGNQHVPGNQQSAPCNRTPSPSLRRGTPLQSTAHPLP